MDISYKKIKQVLKSWLFSQCQMLSGLKNAVVFIEPPVEGSDPRALFWPEEHRDHLVLSSVAQAAFRSKQAVVKAKNNDVKKTGEPLDAMACPLFLGDRLIGVVAMEMSHRSQSMQQAMVQQVQVGAKWLETMILQQEATVNEQLVNLVDLVAAGLEHEQFRVAATEVTNELANRFSCQRVSLGFLRYNRIRLGAMSNHSKIDQHATLVQEIQETMNEALDQGTTVVYPVVSDAGFLISRFHAQLSKSQKGASICTLPLVKNGKAVGAILLERNANEPFTPETVTQCEQIALLLGPVLETRRQDERPLPSKIVRSLQSGCAKLLGPRHLSLKMIAGIALVLAVWLSLDGAMFRISCDSVLEAGICRVVVAPQQGYIDQANVRAGDMVKKGDLLATLDDKELILEQRKWQSQHAQFLKEYRKALSGSVRSEVAIFNAKRAQAEAQLELVEQQLARTRLIAPFSGMIVKGDLSQDLGSPVARGDELFEVAPTDEYRVVLKVDDKDIGMVSLGQQGQLKLSGIPDKSIHITIDRMTPVSSNEGGGNHFRVEAAMDSHSDLMRPGMEGISKIEIRREKLIWIWTRPLVDWLSLFAWNWLP
jgi:RND family efflux transporter MFP subunit